jgi:hypothetical protein
MEVSVMERSCYKSERFYLHKILWSTIFLVSLSLGAGYAFAQGDLAVYINPDSDVYRVGQAVNVTVTVTNDTGAVVKVQAAPGCGIWPINLIVSDLDEQTIWQTNQCPCICCPCAVLLWEIPTGESEYSSSWNQMQTVRIDPCRCLPVEPCGCVREPVKPGFYYLAASVAGAMSDPVLVEIR